MSIEDDFVLGEISRNESVRAWVLQTPTCPKCGFFVQCQFSGLRNEYVWPMCSNTACVLGKHPHTFILPEADKKRARSDTNDDEVSLKKIKEDVE
jgi:hypothetical protein